MLIMYSITIFPEDTRTWSLQEQVSPENVIMKKSYYISRHLYNTKSAELDLCRGECVMEFNQYDCLPHRISPQNLPIQ